ncbi:endopeptidase La [bacterium]|nr:endopeptidase La [bacterium]
MSRGTKGSKMFFDENKHPKNLPVLALRNAVLFPNAIAPMAVGRKFSLAAIEAAQEADGFIAIFTQRDPKVENPAGEDLHAFGTLAKILKVMDERSSSTQTVLLQGLARIQGTEFSAYTPHMRVDVDYPLETPVIDAEVEALAKKTKELALQVIQLSPNIPGEARQFVDEMQEIGPLCDLIAANMSIPVDERIAILETLDIKARCRRIIRLLNTELEMLRVKKRIDEEIRGELDRNQKEFYLRKQMDAIRKELGDDDGAESDIDDFRKRIDEAELPKDALDVAERELKRLQRIPPSSPEHTVSHTYLEWILDLPWNEETEDHIDLKEAEKILDEDSYGLEKVKRRILEYLAVRKLKPGMKGPILCLVGPPGVGKTSLGSSVARSMGRKFYRMSLGGLHDEAEIRGHRRTYIGSMPGRILQTMKKVGVRNPVFVLDELDKVGADFRGDPSSALLEVLDPEQNFAFSDNYLQIPFDLSKVLFIGTANRMDTVPPALRDRLEVIEIPGYTTEEKMIIARQHLIKQELENHGLTAEQIEITDDALARLIDHYTHEAGVRELKRNIASICRAGARIIAGGEAEHVQVTGEKVGDILGAERYYPEVAERTSVTGVATGMAWTPAGGDILFIEASMMKGKGNLILTGKLGEVMQESAKAALSYIRSKAEDFNIDPQVFQDYDIHIHIPAGAIGKDGPSAGITLLAALASLLTGRKVNADMAMTGEVTLRGQVLQVGGIKEKILAAKRAGIKRILLPEKNRKDLLEIPERLRAGVEFHFINNIDEALASALEAVAPPPPAPGAN